MVLRGPLASNSVLAPMIYSTTDTDDVAFVDAFKVTQINRSTICISVKEKKPVGCIHYLDSYVFFDRNGIFVEGSKTRDESVPYFDGIQVNSVVMDEKLDIKGDSVLNTAVALSTIFQKNEMIPDHIQFDSSYSISLIYGDITVQLGKDEDLEEKDILSRNDVKQWYTETGIALLSVLIDELNVQGHKRLVIHENGDVLVTVEGKEQAVDTIPDFPPRPAWDDLCVLAREDDISAEVRGQELAVSWP